MFKNILIAIVVVGSLAATSVLAILAEHYKEMARIQHATIAIDTDIIAGLRETVAGKTETIKLCQNGLDEILVKLRQWDAEIKSGHYGLALPR